MATGGACMNESAELVNPCDLVDENSTFLARFGCSYTPYHNTVACAICAIGVLANMAIIVVLCQRTMRRGCINPLLLFIAICDCSLMGTNIIYLYMIDECRPNYMGFYRVLFVLFFSNLSVVAHSLSLWLTVAMAVFRFFMVKGNLSKSIDNASYAIGATLAIAFGIVVPGFSLNFMRNTVEYKERMNLRTLNEISKEYMPAYCHKNSSMVENIMVDHYEFATRSWFTCSMDRVNYWMTSILFKFIPCIALTVFMTLLLHTLYTARLRAIRLKGSSASTSQGDRTTAMLVMIVLIFLLTELPSGLFMMIAAFGPSGDILYQQIGDLIDLLALINSSVNFILYCVMSTKFREQFAITFHVEWLCVNIFRRDVAATPNTMRTGTTRITQSHREETVKMLPIIENPADTYRPPVIEDAVSMR